ncbi:Uncharacterised protein [Ewingella americana]|uniref:Uncharacterized protein n=1 Tax=Ewingella americana TaxID=41202 RepID=A0A377NC01_9GAMM|nr:Uncharacterised protein [Ewingella americana]
MFCSFGNYRKLLGQDCGLAAHNGLKVKTVRCRHTGLKVKTVGSPPTLLKSCATQISLKVKVVRCRHTGLKVKTLRCHANWPKGF